MGRSPPPPTPLKLPILGLHEPRYSALRSSPSEIPAVAGAGASPVVLFRAPSEFALPEIVVLNFNLTLPVADEEFYRITFVGTKLLPLLSRYPFILQTPETVIYAPPSFKCQIREISSIELSILSNSHVTVLHHSDFPSLPKEWLKERNLYEVGYLDSGIFLRPYMPSATYVASSGRADRSVLAHRDVPTSVGLLLKALRDELALAKTARTETDDGVSNFCCIIC